jgi:hypothetical protein
MARSRHCNSTSAALFRIPAFSELFLASGRMHESKSDFVRFSIARLFLKKSLAIASSLRLAGDQLLVLPFGVAGFR